jgi:N-acetylmuramoyl-L-alanine amidase
MMAGLLIALLIAAPLPQSSSATIPRGATVFINTMPNEFDTYLKTAIVKKKVPVVLVDSRDRAQFEIKGTSESQKAGAAKKIVLGSWHSDEQASISVTNIESGAVVYAYSANKKNSAHGRQTTAEACAKHLKEAIEKN